jgi:deferrochelatase/peroxidase EfeB
VELREGGTAASGDDSKPKRAEMSRRSTPYAFHDGTIGLYFMGFCATQAPLKERMTAMYDSNGEHGVRDAVTDYSTPASGSFYFARSEEALKNMQA